MQHPQRHLASDIDVFCSKIACFSIPRISLTPHSGWTPCDINVTYTSLKSAFNGLQFRRQQYGPIFIRLAVVASETREMSRNSKRIRTCSNSRSSKVIDLGVIGEPMCDFLFSSNETSDRWTWPGKKPRNWRITSRMARRRVAQCSHLDGMDAGWTKVR